MYLGVHCNTGNFDVVTRVTKQQRFRCKPSVLQQGLTVSRFSLHYYFHLHHSQTWPLGSRTYKMAVHRRTGIF